MSSDDLDFLNTVLRDAEDENKMRLALQALGKLKVTLGSLDASGIVKTLNIIKKGALFPAGIGEASRKTIMSMASSLKDKWKKELSRPSPAPEVPVASVASVASEPPALPAPLPAPPVSAAPPPPGDDSTDEEEPDIFAGGKNIEKLKRVLEKAVTDFCKSKTTTMPIIGFGLFHCSGSGSGVSVKMRVNVCSNRKLFGKEADSWNRRQNKGGTLISKTWYGKTFVWEGRTLKVVKANAGNPKMPVIAVDKTSGQRFKYHPTAILRRLSA